MKQLTVLIIIGLFCLTNNKTSAQNNSEPIIINHECTNIFTIPEEYINKAKQNLIIAYGHTSHGSQITSGMSKLDQFMTNHDYAPGMFEYSNTGNNNTLEFRDNCFDGANDLGNPNRSAWAQATRNYLEKSPETNVIMWSWCGQVSSASADDIELYLTLMNELEEDFQTVNFVYMTGHLDGSGENGQLNKNNETIRKYCRENNKILFDFADLESYDPDGETNYMQLFGNDNCDYTSPDNEQKNWAIDWQNSHTENVDWYQCSSAHSQALAANLKAFAAWWMFAELAGWERESSVLVKHHALKNEIKPYISNNTIRFIVNSPEQIIQTTLFNSTGQIIYSNNNQLFNHSIDIGELQNTHGIIFYRLLSNNNRKYTGKFLINRQ
jgi:hypothetical protein